MRSWMLPQLIETLRARRTNALRIEERKTKAFSTKLPHIDSNDAERVRRERTRRSSYCRKDFCAQKTKCADTRAAVQERSPCEPEHMRDRLTQDVFRSSSLAEEKLCNIGAMYFQLNCTVTCRYMP